MNCTTIDCPSCKQSISVSEFVAACSHFWKSLDVVRFRCPRCQKDIFVVVDQIASEEVTGRIASHIDLVQGYRAGQRIRFPESDVIDWMISKPDGSEEGNFVGKFLDTVPRRN